MAPSLPERLSMTLPMEQIFPTSWVTLLAGTTEVTQLPCPNWKMRGAKSCGAEDPIGAYQVKMDWRVTCGSRK